MYADQPLRSSQPPYRGAQDLKDISAETSGAGLFGAEYFEKRLAIGALHNAINLPLKWYLGSYVTYFDLTRASLRRHYPYRPMLCARAERALFAVFNYDMQAIVEAFYYDTFATIGLDLAEVDVPDVAHDLSDHGAQLKSRVTGKIKATCGAAQQVGDASREIAGETAGLAGRTREVAQDGVQAAAQASQAMVAVRDNAEDVADAIQTLAGKSEQIGKIVDIAGQITSDAATMKTGINEVALVAEQASASAEQVSAATQQSSASTQQTAASAAELARTADELTGIVGQFRVAD